MKMLNEAELLKQHIYDCCNVQEDGCKGCYYDFYINDNCACYLILMSIGAYEKC